MMSFLSDVWYTFTRRMRFYQRQAGMTFSTVMQPLLWILLFAPLLQNIALMPGFPTSNYLEFFTPGVIAVLALYSSLFAGFIVATDVNFGVLEKLVVTPANRYAIILGEVLSSTFITSLQELIVFSVAAALGVTIATSASGLLLVLVIVGLLSVGIASLSNALIIKVKKSEVLGAVSGIVTLPLMFVSSIMMPSEFAPKWLQTAMKFNPVYYAVEAIRPLFISGYDWPTILTSLIVLGAFAVGSIVVATLALRKYE